MKEELTLKRSESVNAAMKHPVAAGIGGAVTAFICSGVAVAASASPVVGMLMGVIGLGLGAVGAAHVAESAASNREV